MPYIKSGINRAIINGWLEKFDYITLDGVGELNYAITRLISNYLGPEMDYARLNSITGVLHDVAVEFDRRVVAPYEDKKIQENGDVYPDNQLSLDIQSPDKKGFSSSDKAVDTIHLQYRGRFLE